MNVTINLALSTRAQRRSFKQAVGTRVYNVVRDTMLGSNTATIASRYHAPRRAVAAIKANLTRGAYEPFAIVNSDDTGLCSFGG